MAGSRRNTLWMRDLYEGSLAKNRLPQLFFRPVYSEFESKILYLGQDLNGTSVRRCELQ